MKKARDQNLSSSKRVKTPARADALYDVIVVGGGPAGSVLAWELARHNVKTLVLDRARFPRVKVCGDYVEPRGLRLLDAMQCLKPLEADSPLPITHTAIFVESVCRYRGRIPFYGRQENLPPHGYIIPREQLDHLLLRAAAQAGAQVREETTVTAVSTDEHGVHIEARRGNRKEVYRGRMVVGADGVSSIVARSAGLLADDPRHTAISQRAYASGIEGDVGEAAFFFETDLFPGYGWMFPIAGGMVNFGVGVLAETSQRMDISVPQLFREFFEKLKRSHHRYANLQLCGPPIGGIVKTYGGAGRNYFERGLLIGDAGSFVDPMTGEGITPAMESALIAACVIRDALAAGRFDAGLLSVYEKNFRAYFDPSMIFVDLCAATMRNRHLGEMWLKAVARGCELAQRDRDFAHTTGACFGGLEIDPSGVLSQLWINMAAELATLAPRSLMAFIEGTPNPLSATVREIIGWQVNGWKSFLADPVWHAGWMLDLEKKWLHALAVMSRSGLDPRAKGLL